MIRQLIIALALVLSMSSLVLAAATTGDINVDSEAGIVITGGGGTDVNAESNVHSVDVKDGGNTGDINVQGTNLGTMTIGTGHDVNAESNVGSVKVGE